MVFNALKRIVRPQYRVVVDIPSGYVYVQRQSILGRWIYVCDGLGAVEFVRVQHAFDFVDCLHDTRKYDVHLFIDLDGI